MTRFEKWVLGTTVTIGLGSLITLVVIVELSLSHIITAPTWLN